MKPSSSYVFLPTIMVDLGRRSSLRVCRGAGERGERDEGRGACGGGGASAHVGGRAWAVAHDRSGAGEDVRALRRSSQGVRVNVKLCVKTI